MIDSRELAVLGEALATLEQGFEQLPGFTPEFDAAATAEVLQRVARRLHDNYPYFHPLYAGRASSAMEKECIATLGRLFGWDAPLGHLAGGGTMANLEALWVAGRLHPGKRVLASEQAHYTHGRISDVLGIPFTAMPVDDAGRLDTNAVAEALEEGDVGTVVATIGTTGLGAVDPLPRLLELQSRFDFRIHADAAYGGYFGLSSLLGDRARAAFDALAAVDSIVIDPHKHGLQPYGCGCVLFRDPSVGSLYKHGSPYTYFSSADLHLGEISLECSRPGAAAVALWATMQLLPPEPGGVFAGNLDASLRAARALRDRLDASATFVPLLRPELDIVVYAVRAPDTGAASAAARQVFERAAARDLHLALAELPAEFVLAHIPQFERNSDTVTCLRSVLMKPEQENWVDEITARLEASAA